MLILARSKGVSEERIQESSPNFSALVKRKRIRRQLKDSKEFHALIQQSKKVIHDAIGQKDHVLRNVVNQSAPLTKKNFYQARNYSNSRKNLLER